MEGVTGKSAERKERCECVCVCVCVCVWFYSLIHMYYVTYKYHIFL